MKNMTMASDMRHGDNDKPRYKMSRMLAAYITIAEYDSLTTADELKAAIVYLRSITDDDLIMLGMQDTDRHLDFQRNLVEIVFIHLT